jgi:hypothetical protein
MSSRIEDGGGSETVLVGMHGMAIHNSHVRDGCLGGDDYGSSFCDLHC